MAQKTTPGPPLNKSEHSCLPCDEDQGWSRLLRDKSMQSWVSVSKVTTLNPRAWPLLCVPPITSLKPRAWHSLLHLSLIPTHTSSLSSHLQGRCPDWNDKDKVTSTTTAHVSIQTYPPPSTSTPNYSDSLPLRENFLTDSYSSLVS